MNRKTFLDYCAQRTDEAEHILSIQWLNYTKYVNLFFSGEIMFLGTRFLFRRSCVTHNEMCTWQRFEVSLEKQKIAYNCRILKVVRHEYIYMIL